MQSKTAVILLSLSWLPHLSPGQQPKAPFPFSIPKPVYEWGEVIPLRVGPQADDHPIHLVIQTDYGRDRKDPGGATLWKPDYQTGVYKLDTKEISRYRVQSHPFASAYDDLNRLRFRLSVPEYTKKELSFFMVWPVSPAAGSLAMPGGTDLAVGQPVEVLVHGISRWRDLPQGLELRVFLVRHAQAVPGGAVTREVVVGATKVPMDQDRAKVAIRAPDVDHPSDPELVWMPGPHQLRLVHPTGAIIDSLEMSFVVPTGPSLALVPAPSPAVTRERPSKLRLTIPPSFPAHLRPHLSLMTFFVGRDRVLHHVSHEPATEALEKGEVDIPGLFTSLNAGWFRSGRYEVHLVLGDHGSSNRVVMALPSPATNVVPFTLAHVGFDASGEMKAPAHLEFGEVALRVSPEGPVEVGQTVEVEARRRDGTPVTGKDFYYTLHLRGGHAWGCARYLDVACSGGADHRWSAAVSQLANAAPGDTAGFWFLSDKGTASIRLPENDVGGYEVRLMQGHPPGHDFYLDNSLVARAPIEVKLTPRDVFALAEGSVLQIGETVPFDCIPGARIDADYTEGSLGRLTWELPSVQPGGAVRGWTPTGRTPSWPGPGLYREGDYELALHWNYPRWGQVVVSRRGFRVVDHREPRAPIPYLKAPVYPWPSADDPIRGIEAHSPSGKACGGEDIPLAKLRVVEVLYHDRDVEEDDEYRAVEAPRPGYPFFVEACFAEAPPDDLYTVWAGATVRVPVTRSKKDPAFFRSGIRMIRQRLP